MFTPLNNVVLDTILGVIAAIVIVSAVYVFNALILQVVWNGVIPFIFPAIKQVSFVQSFGLVIIASILFGRTINNSN